MLIWNTKEDNILSKNIPLLGNIWGKYGPIYLPYLPGQLTTVNMAIYGINMATKIHAGNIGKNVENIWPMPSHHF